MKKLISAALVAACIVAACGDNTATRLGTAGPTSPVGSFVVSSDPSVDAGFNAVPGTFGRLADGSKAWEKVGTADTQWQLVAHNPVVFDSRDFNGGAVLNLMTTTSNYLLTPTLPGYYLVPIGGSAAVKFVATTGSGSTPVAPTGNYGNNGSTRTNWSPSASGTPVANTGFAAGVFPYTVNCAISSAPTIADLATPLGVDVTVAATTATTWAGYFLTTGYLYKF